jgi:hypothetical protein
MRSLADFNGDCLLGGAVLADTATVAVQGALVVDQVIEVGTFAVHGWGLSHGHGHDTRRHWLICAFCDWGSRGRRFKSGQPDKKLQVKRGLMT